MRSLLTDNNFTIVDRGGQPRVLTLPGLLAALVIDAVDDLPTVRPHQRQALHAFLAQIGALALLAARENRPPDAEEEWAALLRGLTPDHDDDAPWCLVVHDLSRPALLQPPVPEGRLEALNKREMTPDAIDMLVTAKNHDVKSSRLVEARPEHWFYALLTLQTMEGFLGAGNYGISRMNGGFASRPMVGLAPPGGWGVRLARDIRRLVDLRNEMSEAALFAGYRASGGLALLWLAPWDGKSQLRPADLDPYYVEICRRVRLVEEEGRIVAVRSVSKASRIAVSKESNGETGDPWTPIDLRDEKKGSKALTVRGSGFDYKLVTAIMSDAKFRPAPLQRWRQDDGRDGLALVLTALVRGQGGTDGFHERRVPIPPTAVPLFGHKNDPYAALAKLHVEDAGQVRGSALRTALFVLFQNAPDKPDKRHPPSERKAQPFLAAFDRAVDTIFFEAIDEELAAAGDEKKMARERWLERLGDLAKAELERAAKATPLSGLRRYTTIEAARSMLDATLAKSHEKVAGGSA